MDVLNRGMGSNMCGLHVFAHGVQTMFLPSHELPYDNLRRAHCVLLIRYPAHPSRLTLALPDAALGMLHAAHPAATPLRGLVLAAPQGGGAGRRLHLCGRQAEQHTSGDDRVGKEVATHIEGVRPAV